MDLTLQALVDRQRVPLERLGWWLTQAAKGGITGVQLREKAGPTRESYAYGMHLSVLSRQLGLWFSVNDRVDLALALSADLVHLGPEDIPPDAARRIAPDLAIGLSARNLAEIRWALAFHPVYIGYGPVWPTASKPDATAPVGLDNLSEAVRLAAPCPVVAIGGITVGNAAATWASGVAGLATISALTEAVDVKTAAASLSGSRTSCP